MGFGQILREAREAKGYSVAQLADMTHIMSRTIEGLENEDFRSIAAPIYGRGFVKLLCQILGIEPKPMIDEFMAIYNGEKPAQRTSPAAPIVEKPIPVAPAAEEPAVEPSVREEPVVEPPVAEAPVVPTIEEPVVQEPTIEKPTVQEPAVQEPTIEKPAVQEPTIEKPVVQEPVAEVPPAFRSSFIQEPTSSEPPPSDPFRHNTPPPPAKPTVSSDFGELFDTPASEPAAPKIAASSRFAPPQPQIGEPRNRHPFVMPEIPWRLIALIVGALIVLWLLIAGCRAVYRALSAPSDNEPATVSQDQVTEPPKPVEPAVITQPVKSVKTVEPVKQAKAAKTAEPVKPVKAVEPAKPAAEATPDAAKPPRKPKSVKPLYID